MKHPNDGDEDYGYHQDAIDRHDGVQRLHATGLDGSGAIPDPSGAAAAAARSTRRRVNVTAEAAPHDLSYRPSRVLLYSPPRQRQAWGDAQILPRVNWGDLFFDLFYVAATYNVSNVIVDSPDKTGLLYAAGTFLPVMGIWTQKTLYDGRVVTEADVFHRLLNVVMLVVLGVAISHIRPVGILSDASNESSMFVFALMLVVDRLFTIALFLEVYFRGVGQKQLKAAACREIRFITVSLSCYVAATTVAALEYFGNGVSVTRLLAEVAEQTNSGVFAEASTATGTTNVPIYLCLIGYVGGQLIASVTVAFCLPGGGRHKEIAVPINVDFVIHRSGEWIMLMLGESIVSLLIVDVAHEGPNFFTVFYCGLLTVVFLQILHFQSQPHDAESHAMRRSKNMGVLWSMFQHVYSLALVVLGASFTFFLMYSDGRDIQSASDSEADIQQAAAHLFGGTLSVIFFALDMMTLLHLGKDESQKRCEIKGRKNFKGIAVVAIRIGLVGFTASLSQWLSEPKDLAVIGLVCVLAQLLLRKFGTMYLSHRQQIRAVDGPGGEVKVVAVENDDETGEAQWPNVTHARADSESDGDDQEE